MKIKLLALLWFAALASVAYAVVLEWDASAGPDAVGYRIKYGYASGVYSTTVEVNQNLTATIDEPWPVGTTIYFAAYAYNSAGIESLPSNEVAFTVAPPPPPPPTPTPLPTPSPTPGPPQKLRIKLTLTISMTNQWPPGSFVQIVAPKPAPGYDFDQWTGDTATLDNFMQRRATVTIPSTIDVYLVATYKKTL